MSTLYDLGEFMFGGQDKLIDYLKQNNLLATNKTCSSCAAAMVISPRSDISDGYRFRCPNCHKCISLRDGSFFSKSCLNLKQWLMVIYFWSKMEPVQSAAMESHVSEPSSIQIYQWLREVCSTKLLQQPIRLGGPGKIVQIDESLMRHKPKHHRGRATSREIWVFGMAEVDPSQRHLPALGYMQIVARRNAATLLPIIRRTVLPGTTVWSDQWSSYSRVGQIPGVVSHGVVNHSVTFVNPTTGVHTQAIESYWNRVKIRFKRMKGVAETQLPSYLDEFMWRERYGKTNAHAYLSILKHIAEIYPV